MHFKFLTDNLLATSLILSTFASERPLTSHNRFFVVIMMPFIVQIPTPNNFLISATFYKKSKYLNYTKSKTQSEFKLNLVLQVEETKSNTA